MSNTMLYVISVVVWGSTWLAISYQLGNVELEVSLVYRYGIATVLLFGWCLLQRLPMRFGLFAHIRFMLLGLLLFSLNYIGTYSAQLYITSALNAVAFSTMMWMNVLNTRLFFGTKIEPKVYLGAALGMLGIIVLFWPEVSSISWSDRTLLGVAFCLSGALLASLGNMVSQSAQQQGLPVLQSNAWGMFYGTLFTGLIAIRQGHPFAFDTSAAYVISLLYLAVFGSIVAFGTYLKLLGRIGAHKAGYAVVMFPVVALILSVLFEDLQISMNIIAGVLLVLFGNVIVLGAGQSKPWLSSLLKRLKLQRAA